MLQSDLQRRTDRTKHQNGHHKSSSCTIYSSLRSITLPPTVQTIRGTGRNHAQEQTNSRSRTGPTHRRHGQDECELVAVRPAPLPAGHVGDDDAVHRLQTGRRTLHDAVTRGGTGVRIQSAAEGSWPRYSGSSGVMRDTRHSALKLK